MSENIAHEIGDALRKTYNTLSGFVVTSAPKHKTGYACLIAQCTADFLELDYKELFFTVQDANAKRNIWGDRPEITIRETPLSILWIDDTLTTGRTLSACRALCLQSIFIPIVWIYDDAKTVDIW